MSRGLTDARQNAESTSAYLLILVGALTLVGAVLHPAALALHGVDVAGILAGRPLIDGSQLLVTGGLLLISFSTTALGIILLLARAV
jgi:hypothetical protein